MDTIFNDPELKLKYTTCKKTVKLWESEFRRKFGRIPSKHDYREADPAIRMAYKSYFDMKTAALEDTLTDIADFSFDSNIENTASLINENSRTEASTVLPMDENAMDVNYEKNPPPTDIDPAKVWGAHLNKVNVPEKKAAAQLNKSVSLSQKMFVGSKFAKRNPRKSFSFTRQKSKVDVDTVSFSASQPETSSISEDFTPLFTEPIKIINTVAESTTQPVSIVQRCLDTPESKSTRNINKAWLDRICKVNNIEKDSECKSPEQHDSGIGSSPPENSYGLSNLCNIQSLKTYPHTVSDSDDFVANSASENECPEPTSIKHANKKRRILSNDSIVASILSAQRSPSPKPVIEPIPEVNKPIIPEIPVAPEKKTRPKATRRKAPPKKQPSMPARKTPSRTAKLAAVTQTSSMLECLKNDDDEEVDPFHDSDLEDDADFEPDTSRNPRTNSPPTPEIPAKKLARKPTAKTRSVVQAKSTDGKPERKTLFDSDEETGPKEYVELARSKLPPTVPRFQLSKTSIPVVQKTATANKPVAKSKKRQAKEKLEQKMETRNLNENFVRINLQKKVFVRGKKTMTFSKHKKQQWRANKKARALAGPEMDMGGCDGGMLTCFKCGQIGHFARQCKADLGDNLLPLDADAGDVSPFPTLQEASAMASKSKLAIHATRSNVLPRIESEDTSETETGTEADASNCEDDVDDDDILDSEMADLLSVIESSSQTLPQHPIPAEFTASLAIQPLYELNPDGTPIPTPPEVYEALEYFGHSQFRAGQERAIMRILSGQSTLLTLSTGSGKSLCYQLPAYLYSKYRSPSIAIVVSPLVSLMDDQVARSKRTACLHTGMTPTARKKTLELLKSGQLDSLLISPEAIVAGFDNLLRQLPRISFACIDEVHCVSQWSHNFRPSYLTLCRVLRERLGVGVMLGLTATAPLATQQSILEHLHIGDGVAGLIGSAPLPENLTLTVSKDGRREAALVKLLQSDGWRDFRSVVVYCTRREECERLAALLRTCFKEEAMLAAPKKRKRTSWTAEPYHAGLSASKRRTVQNAFMSGELRIVVATVAFGMGINKSDIRAVIHYNMPRNFESYVQEVGRAGRDGLPAHCHVFLDSEGNDQNELRRHVFSDSLDRHVIRKLLQRVFVPCECKSRGISCPKHEVAFPIEETVRLLDIPEENVATLLCYLELHENNFIQVLSSAYTLCKITSYGGAKALREAAQTCPPLAMAVAMEKQRGNMSDSLNVLEFPVVDVAAAIGWESGMVKHHLKNLEWTTVSGQPRRSPLTVQLSKLGFRIRAPGDLSATDLDTALDYLYSRVVQQEKAGLVQLQEVAEAFGGIATPSFGISAENAKENSDKIKMLVLDYFQTDRTKLDEGEIKWPPVNEHQIASDVRSLLGMYKENNFTGRAVARIFHGIGSPNYPPVIWGRCKFWRCNLGVNFNAICKIATQEILRMR